LAVFEKENETHPTTIAAKMKLAMLDLKRGAIDEAM
jgi:hypothetical protein